MDARDLTIRAEDGHALSARLFTPDADARGAVILASAMAVPSRFYAKYAQWLAEQGMAVVSFDYRGMRDRPLRGSPHRMRDWGELDLPAVIDWTTRELAPDRLLYVGHSAGGQLLGLAHNNARVDRAVFVSCQSGYWPNYPNKYLYWALWHIAFPALVRVFGYLPSSRFRFGDDLPPRVALEWARWCRTPGYLYGDPTLASRSNVGNFTNPILAYYFTDDPWATPGTRAEMLAPYRNAAITEKVVHPSEAGVGRVGHMGFFRDPVRDTLWRESLEWLTQG